MAGADRTVGDANGKTPLVICIDKCLNTQIRDMLERRFPPDDETGAPPPPPPEESNARTSAAIDANELVRHRMKFCCFRRV